MAISYGATFWEAERKSIQCFEKYDIRLDAPVPLSVKRYYFDLIMSGTSTTWATGGAALRFVYGIDAGVHDIDILIESMDSDDAKYILDMCKYTENYNESGDKMCILSNGVVISLYNMNYVYGKDKRITERFLTMRGGYRVVKLEQLFAHWLFKVWAYTRKPDVDEPDRLRAPWVVRDIIEMYHRDLDWGLVREAVKYFELGDYIREVLELAEGGNELIKVGYSMCYEWWGYPVKKCEQDFKNAVKNALP